MISKPINISMISFSWTSLMLYAEILYMMLPHITRFICPQFLACMIHAKTLYYKHILPCNLRLNFKMIKSDHSLLPLFRKANYNSLVGSIYSIFLLLKCSSTTFKSFITCLYTDVTHLNVVPKAWYVLIAGDD